MSVDSKRSGAEMATAFKDVFPVLLAIVPFGMVYGTVAAGDGLDMLQIVGFSASVFAGASQLAALQLIGIGAPVWSVLLTVLALNFRHILYSASVGRHIRHFPNAAKGLAFFFLVDPTFGAAEARAARVELTKRYYFVYGVSLYVCWLASSILGGVFGSFIEDPAVYGIDFVLPVYFLALVMTFRTRRTFWPVASASAIASIAIYWTVGPPWHVTFGALAGVGVAAVMPVRNLAGTAVEAEAKALETRL
ncbi:AzlC family ABC transporter permease [Fulvimarina sp. 2208YS6-2-32]|uniref:AzlC family ABC transporter permease n=1 Tax=Fulvimarina uroteuthidis TaxID=3098149 RepID=A0ABU5I2M0_9HYPH|nr:AzlC family ABC transporter permease [Fulvimarina sp. 2208YS6-2-32]MDY8109620.1 AzlC family ABC transporter permease [Fulvimarina sp. 2208YS6-2-32]